MVVPPGLSACPLGESAPLAHRRREALMARSELRLLHSSDWHLEQPLAGLADLTDELKAAASGAPYTAAKQVVETALVEGVDALLLSGDIVDLDRSGP